MRRNHARGGCVVLDRVGNLDGTQESGRNAMIQFFVAGHPRPQGSKRGFSRGGKVIMVESCERLKDWRASIAYNAAKVRPDAPIKGDVEAILEFYLPRPTSHFGTGKNRGMVRPVAPRFPSGHMSGDIDKLTRCVLDGITGVLIADDSQVVRLVAKKLFSDGLTPGVRISISEDSSETGWTEETAAFLMKEV